VDASFVITLQPDFSKGYARKGLALQGLGRHGEALHTLELGLKKDPEDASIKSIIATLPPGTLPIAPVNKVVYDNEEDDGQKSTGSEAPGAEKKSGGFGSFLKKKK